MTKVVAITGGIGSGKTTLSKYLKQKNFFVHESDNVVSKIYSYPSKGLKYLIKNNISKEAVKKDKINKKEITKIIFRDQKAKNIIEKYIHEEVRVSRQKFIKTHTKNKEKIIFADIPLLLEKKLEKKFDFVICVIASKKNRTARVLKNKKFTKTTLNKIFKLQTTDKERRKRAQIIINNNKTKKDFIFNVEKALIDLIK